MKAFLTAIALAVFIPSAAIGQTMDHSQMIHGGQPGMMMQGMLPQETGQSAFAAIQEIVAILSANPATDWSKIDIEALVRTRPSSGPFHTHSTARAISVEVSP